MLECLLDASKFYSYIIVEALASVTEVWKFFQKDTSRYPRAVVSNLWDAAVNLAFAVGAEARKQKTRAQVHSVGVTSSQKWGFTKKGGEGTKRLVTSALGT